MANEHDYLKNLLDRYIQSVDAETPIVEVNSAACIFTSVPDSAGVYWIETTMLEL